jgi:hypothetical protein
MDTCFFGDCDLDNELRPDWDGSRNSVDGDPLATFGGGVEATEILTPATAQSYRVAVHHKRANDRGTVTLNVVVDGVNVFGASKALDGGDLWSGVTARWNGSNVTVTRTDVVTTDFSCGGESCTVDTADGNECDDGFVCDGGNGFTSASVCAQCIDSEDCAGADECRSDYCVDDTTDRGVGGVCTRAVDCRDDLECGGGFCGEPCNFFFCALSPESCCLSGGTCGGDSVCN